MSESLNRPIVHLDPDGGRLFATEAALLHRVSLKVSVYENQLRAELVEWRPGQAPGSTLVWQHHSRSRHLQHTASLDSTGTLARTAEWLAAEGWPGVRF